MTAQDTSAEPRAPSLNALLSLTHNDMQAVNAVILARMHSHVTLIPKLAKHLINSGGKRMRPMLTLACAQLFHYTGNQHHHLAAAVEFIHTATLLHDDVVDNSGMRRGKRTANIIWGNSASVLVGDFLFSRAFESMVEAGSMEALGILSAASAVIAEGEVQQLTAQRHMETGEAEYLAIIRAKTAALFAAACQVSAVVAQQGQEETQAIASYGENLGIAFQLIDDALDYVADSGTMGKDVGDDFRDGKMTLPIIIANAQGDAEERAFWQAAIEGKSVSDEHLAHAQTLIAKHKAIELCLARAQTYGQAAIDALAAFPASPIKAALIETVEFAIARVY
jgi:octaprenyl-diphosphate synthase